MLIAAQGLERFAALPIWLARPTRIANCRGAFGRFASVGSTRGLDSTWSGTISWISRKRRPHMRAPFLFQHVK